MEYTKVLPPLFSGQIIALSGACRSFTADSIGITSSKFLIMKILKIMGLLIGLFALLIGAGGIYIKVALPDTGPPPLVQVKPTPERIANGRYLANHVTVCLDCHSKRDWGRFAGPMMDTEVGAGGEVFDQQMGFPGVFYASNITPANLGSWTDGEIFHAVTTGVAKDGRALFPVMAWERFGKMDQEDIYDIIAYLRTLQPVQKKVPLSKADFPVNFIINTMPKKAHLVKKPEPAAVVSYGAYLVNAAGCVDCHSKTEKGRIIGGTEFGGGMEFKQPAGVLRSPNLTPDAATGIGSWTKEQFVSRFKFYTSAGYISPRIGIKELNTPMPWVMYGGMKEDDLVAVYAYLKTLKPITNEVERFTPLSK
jgi:mono/diheme cytochrome c family protein